MRRTGGEFLSIVLVSQLGCTATRGCVTQEVTYSRVTSSSGTSMPVTPAATGPLARPSSVALEGTVTRYLVNGDTPMPEAGSEGVWKVHTVARGRVTATLSRGFEIGVMVQAASSDWNELVARGLTLRAPKDHPLFGGGVQVRAPLWRNTRMIVGLQAELSISGADWFNEITTTRTARGSAPEETHTTARGTAILFTPHSGFFLSATLVRNLRLLVGGTVGIDYEASPFQRDGTACAASESCADELGADGSPFSPRVQFSGWVTLGYTLGPLTFFAQAQGHALGLTPFGATVGLHLNP